MPLTYRTVVDEATTRRLSRALGRRMFRQPVWGLILVIFVVVTYLGTRPRTGADWVAYGVLLLVGLAAVVLLLRRSLRRQLRRNLPPGTEAWAGFGATALATRTSLGATEHAYANIRSIEQVGDAVVYRLERPGLLCALPAELAPPHEVERVRQAIALRAGR